MLSIDYFLRNSCFMIQIAFFPALNSLTHILLEFFFTFLQAAFLSILEKKCWIHINRNSSLMAEKNYINGTVQYRGLWLLFINW